MNAIMRRALTGAMALSLAAPLAACGSEQQDAGAGKDSIGLLLPESKAARYEKFDRRIISSRIASLCLECKLDYQNAEQKVDAQKRQFDALVNKGVKVIILDPVDAAAVKSWVDSAAKKGVKVIAYDRLAEGDVAAYVSYDNEKIGRLQGQGILAALGSQAAASDVVMMNGSPTDPNAPSYKKGAHAVLDGKVRKIIYEKDIPDWSAKAAKKEMTDVINAEGPEGFDAVYSANDGMAGGIAAALKSAGLKNVPLGGQDAELPALAAAGGRYPVLHHLQGSQAGGRNRRRNRLPPAARQEHQVPDVDHRRQQQQVRYPRHAVQGADRHPEEHEGHRRPRRHGPDRPALRRRPRRRMQVPRPGVTAPVRGKSGPAARSSRTRPAP